jgi:choline-sulfatase/uncharacterized sulfatase
MTNSSSKTKPNVLFILSDQHSAKITGYNGHPNVKTPRLDQMAKEGVRFDNAIVQNPICTPSRVSWLSGQYCHNHGYYGLEGPKPQHLPSLVSHFRENGYRTAAIGKIHCPEYWIEDQCDVFNEVAGTSRDGCPQYDAYIEKKGLSKLRREDLNARNPMGGQSLDGFANRLSYRDGMQGYTAQQSMDFMERCKGESEPFFLHMSFQSPHQVYCAAKEFWDIYEEEQIVLPENADWDLQKKAPNLIETSNNHREGKWVVNEPKTFEAGRLRKLRGYLACVSEVDHAIGEVLDFLKDNGLEENTIVVYASDHGDYACEHGIMEKAPGICSDAITRVPFIWQWPKKFSGGSVKKELMESVDLAPTLCELTGVPKMNTTDGHDITHLLTGGDGEVRDIAVCEFAWSKSVRKDKYLYVHYPKEMFIEEYPDGFGELYDLEHDPWEMNNLWFKAEYKSLVNEFKNDLLEWLIKTNRPVTVMTDLKDKIGQPGWTYRYGKCVARDGKVGHQEISSYRRSEDGVYTRYL